MNFTSRVIVSTILLLQVFSVCFYQSPHTSNYHWCLLKLDYCFHLDQKKILKKIILWGKSFVSYPLKIQVFNEARVATDSISSGP